MSFRNLLWSVALMASALGAFPARAADKISGLDQARLTSLVQDLDAFYKSALDVLFEVNHDEEERQLGLRAGQHVLAAYDARVAGRCTKILASQSLHQYIGIAYTRMSAKATDGSAAKLLADYGDLLKKYELTSADLKTTGDCGVFEYDLEALYESPITVADPGWWIFNQNRQTKTFVRIVVKAQKADGTVELEAYVGAGAPKGRYFGVARRDLHSTAIQVSLMREKDPLLIDGELQMSGTAFRDPLTNEPAPKMPARVLSGVLTIHDGESRTLNNAVLLLARESDSTIGRALGGFNVPADAGYGSYLNVVLVRFKGRGIGRDAAKFVALVDDAYGRAQKDNPVRSFHPTRKPLFVTDDEAAFLVTDVASDVNALAAALLRSDEFARKAGELGARVSVVPFYQVKDGKLRIRFPGEPANETAFKGFEGLARSLFMMNAAIAEKQREFFEQFGIKAISEEVRGLIEDASDSFKAMGPILESLLETQAFDAELDKKLSAAMSALKSDRDEVIASASTILDTRDTGRLLALHEKFVRAELEVGRLASAGVPSEKADFVKELTAKLEPAAEAALARSKKLAASIDANAKAIEATLDYMNKFTVRIELEGKSIGPNGKLASWTWKWERTLSSELEAFFTGEKNGKKPTDSRRGD
jgi:hypothetical protein